MRTNLESNRPADVHVHEDGNCNLTWLDPWDPMIADQIQRSLLPEIKCKPKQEVRSQLENNVLVMIDGLSDGESCRHRCIIENARGNKTNGPWLELNNPKRPKCNIVEVECKNNQSITYQFLHTQIYKKKKSTKPKAQKMPDIHIIVLDSVSMSHARRALFRTLNFLETEMQAKVFNHLNKVGLNSLPNYYPLLQGIAVSGEKLVPFKSERVVDDQPKLFCDLPEQNSSFVLAKLKRLEYTTFLNEDWKCLFFSSNACPSDAELPVDHYFGSFFERKYEIWPETRLVTTRKRFRHSNQWAEYCIKKHQEMLNQLNQFVRSHPNRPKASLSWISYVAHDNKTELFYSDSDFRKFFTTNQKHFDNSFVFFLSDHGSRLYDSTSVPVDRQEDNNPFFVMTVPKQLRENFEFVAQVERNSRQLFTHFDTYATFVDIIENINDLNRMPSFDAKEFSTYKSPISRGSSLFRPLPQPRNCHTLSIPFDYCSCTMNTTPLNNQSLALSLAQMAVKKINQVINDANELRDFCTKLNVDRTNNPPVVERLETKETTDTVYRFTFHTSPGDGLYLGYALQNSTADLILLSEKFPRQNSYGQQAYCLTDDILTDRFFLNYCFCKDLLNKR
ncbi:Protein of unknown function DUF229 domain containing protein [Aphelenchoides besseyi]|nr:Protein of unknown function DUF229 domain containing protein [Aphelenchoides besseyi]